MTRTRAAAAWAIGMSAAIAGLVTSVMPVAVQSGEASTKEQLDRIEQKLDRIIERLGIAGEGASAAENAGIRPSVSGDDLPEANDIPPPPGVETPEPYRRGAVAIVRVAPEKNDGLSDIPADSVGSFVYSGGAIPLSELSRSGVRYTGLAAAELQGWLKVTEAGRTQLSVEYRMTTGSNVFTDPTCLASVWLEDRSLGSQHGEIPMPARQQKTASFVFGADLQPGLYKLRAWLACTPPRDLKTLNAELLIKTPADMNLRTVTGKELLHQGG